MKIMHIITSIDDGGAEKTLYKLCKYEKLNSHIVISLKGKGKYYTLLKKLRVKVYCLDLKFYSIAKFFYLVKIIKQLKPDLIQTWLVHGDFFGSLAGWLACNKNIVWNIRYSNLESNNVKSSTLLLIKILSKLSHIIPKKIIVVSKNAKKIYKNLGYDAKKFYHIPNGYDFRVFKIDKLKRINFRNKFKIDKKLPLLGFIARFDPMKDHLNLLNALSIIKKKNYLFLCILVGSNIDKNNKKLILEIEKRELTNSIKLLGQINDITSVMNGLDLHILSSKYGEGFPNVVAESMACGTPNIVTNVGSSRSIVGKSGWIVSKKNSKKLSKAIEKALNEIYSNNWKIRCKRSSAIIRKNFDINKMLFSYNKIWKNILKHNN